MSISTFLTLRWSQLRFFGRQTGLIASERWMFSIHATDSAPFAQQTYFPSTAVFSPFQGYLRDALNYLDEPLGEVEGTQERLTL